jgi:poly(3-hydroxybutyrate) depolymerase
VAVLSFNGTSDFIVTYKGGFPSTVSELPSVPETMSRWQKRASCAAGARSLAWHSGEVRCEAAVSCRTPQIACTVQSGGHTWPGGFVAPYLGHTTSDVDATETMLDFFATIVR